MVKARENLLSAYAFLIGIILAVIIGVLTEYDVFQGNKNAYSVFYLTLVILGILIGYLNSGDKDSTIFLFASLALVIVGGQGNSTLVFISSFNPVLSVLNQIVRALLVLFIPSTIIVALKVVFSMAKV